MVGKKLKFMQSFPYFVDDHSVLHVVAGVGDDGHDGVRPHRVGVHAVEWKKIPIMHK